MLDPSCLIQYLCSIYMLLYGIQLDGSGINTDYYYYLTTEYKAPLINHSQVVYPQFCTLQYILTLEEVQYSTVQYSTVQYSTVQYSTVQYSTVQFSTVKNGTVQHRMIQSSALDVHYSTVMQIKVHWSTILFRTV